MNSSFHLFCAAVLAFAAGGCKRDKTEGNASSSGPPAKIITENDLASIELTPKAEQRLGISNATVTLKKVGRKRSLGGELLLPLGRAANSSQDASKHSKSIYALLPAMTPAELVRVAEMQVDADGQIAAAKVQLEAAKMALTRAQDLVKSQAGTQRSMDEARAQVQLSEAALQTARERRALLGAPLFDMVQQDALWVRVPIYAGEVDRIDRTAPAQVGSVSDRHNQTLRAARLVTAPFSSSATASTVDLFFELENQDDALRPGQKVTVTIPLEGEVESLVVPKSAVLYDIHGGTWVYENSALHTFTRRRVEIRYFTESDAVIARGPKAGAKIVTDGAAELFGTEFGIGK